ncbi:MAG: tripartite tricarboxylate transporter substrate binding protein [Zoogloeaceae bacterium]|jgi:tripartite-type tricarboxylate transporter receptor subunit TctC|nr:tripartite tricarboxylate transporter substrate binding protein [Zoogloeaceae bacterium]
MRWSGLALSFVLLSIFLVPDAQAQDNWPGKPFRLVVAYPAGGGLDLVARAVADPLSEILKQPVVVENRGGASGSIGANFVAKAAPDGYTLLMASPAEVVVGPAAGQKTPYHPERDFVPVALAGETPLAIVVHSGIPADSLQGFIALAKSNPGKWNYGTPGAGSTMHFAGESFKAATGVVMEHTPYRGAAPAVNDVLGQHISMVIVGMPPIVPHVNAGRLKALAVTTIQRSPTLPNAPAVAELPGMQDFRFTNWMGVFAPAHTPPTIVERLGREIAKVVADPAVRAKLAAAGVVAEGLYGKEFEVFLRAERQRYQRIAKEQGIRFAE